jgi:hypothetical protein
MNRTENSVKNYYNQYLKRRFSQSEIEGIKNQNFIITQNTDHTDKWSNIISEDQSFFEVQIG